MSDINLTEISGPIAEAIDVLRVCTEQSVYDADDLIAKLLTARSRAERAGIALHLAEKFVAMVIAGPIDPGTTVVGRDLIAAINRAKGVPAVLAHYQDMANEAQAVHA